MKTFLFYLFIDFWAVTLLFCADQMVSDRKRELMQSSNKSVWLDMNFRITGRHVCFFASFMALFFVSAMRDHVGTDYRPYAQTYININKGYIDIWNAWLSPGYVLINKMLGLIDPNNYFLLFTLMAFMTMWYLMKAIYKMSCDWFMSLYLFISFCYYYQSFNQFRQILAVTITTYSCYFLMRGRLKTFLLYVIFAALFHKSALIMAGMCFVYKREINLKNLCLYALLCAVINIGFNTLITVLISFTNYGGYIGSIYDTYMDGSTILNTLVRIIILAGCLMFSKKTIERVPEMVTFYNSALVCTVLQTMAMWSHIFGRITTYFYAPYIILIPEVLKTVESYFDKSSARLIRFFVIVLLLIYHGVYFFNTPKNGVLTYRMLFVN